MASVDCSSALRQIIDERGPITVAAFVDVALYDPGCGYYARAAQRTGRAGDFFTSVDVGTLFGELLGAQVAEMADILARTSAASEPFDLVEGGAGNGRLAADLVSTLAIRHQQLYSRTRLHLVERSAAARAAHVAVLGRHRGLLASSSENLNDFSGVLIANELLDALPPHQVVMRESGLREVYVDLAGGGDRFRLVEGPPSTPSLAAYLARVGARLEPGWTVEINLRAVEWVQDAATRLRRGFLVLFDYGHPAAELYSAAHCEGTLTAYLHHHASGPERETSRPAWLEHPGTRDITTHVDFTSIQQAAEAAGCTTLALLDQTYFLLGVLEKRGSVAGLAFKERLALKTLIQPGALGSTMKVLVLGKGVGRPALACTSLGMRLT